MPGFPGPLLARVCRLRVGTSTQLGLSHKVPTLLTGGPRIRDLQGPRAIHPGAFSLETVCTGKRLGALVANRRHDPASCRLWVQTVERAGDSDPSGFLPRGFQKPRKVAVAVAVAVPRRGWGILDGWLASQCVAGLGWASWDGPQSSLSTPPLGQEGRGLPGPIHHSGGKGSAM